MNRFTLFYLFLALIACATNSGPDFVEYRLLTPPKIAINEDLGDIFLGGLSGLTIKHSPHQENLSNLQLITVTDRGPNTNPYDFDNDGFKDRGFVIPEFNPSIVITEIKEKRLHIVERIPLKSLKGIQITGLPNENRTAKNQTFNQFDETPFNLNKEKLTFNPNGIDPEGITIDSSGNYWICDEYGPSLLKVSQNGVILKRFLPNVLNSKRDGIKALPEIISMRKLNRGFEGITMIGDKVYTALQSPLPYGKWKNERINHIIEFDTKKEKTTGHYLYFMEEKGTKIGALARTFDNKILILEQNGKTQEKNFRKIYKLDISKATNVLSLKLDIPLTKEKLKKEKITPVLKKEFLDLSKGPLNFIEKVEGMTMTNHETIIIAVDNDFGVGKLIDKKSGNLNKSSINKFSSFYKIKL